MRQFQKLARMAEADGHLQQRIKQLLKLSKEKWDAACEHAKTAVQVSTSPSVWLTQKSHNGWWTACRSTVPSPQSLGLTYLTRSMSD